MQKYNQLLSEFPYESFTIPITVMARFRSGIMNSAPIMVPRTRLSVISFTHTCLRNRTLVDATLIEDLFYKIDFWPLNIITTILREYFLNYVRKFTNMELRNID